jgi:hypothetical protein
MLKKIPTQYIIGIGLSLLTIPIVDGTLTLLPDIGWHFITITYVTIFVSQIIFYFLTTKFNFLGTSISFFLNFIFWTLEQVNIEKIFNKSFIYNGEYSQTCVLILGGLLWVSNKIFIEKLYELYKSMSK